MKAIPGGKLPFESIRGRDLFVEELWSILEGNSIRLEAERRIGKTHILTKMAHEPSPGWEVVSLDLEKVHSAAEFAEQVCEAVREKLTGWKKQGGRIQSFMSRFGGVEVGPLRFPDQAERSEGYWKTLLSSSIEDLVEQQEAAGKRVVFLFDEMPWMIAAIADPKREGEQTAMEVLDVLRALRQSATTGSGFRMVLCGSIGLHHVLNVLREQGYNNQPVNDMMLVEVPPLDPESATELAGLLIDGEGLQSEAQAAAHDRVIGPCGRH